ncbi:Yip1 family protein [Roseicyclus persicicus]|uniref:YIP1 family protein n=1 Tax=Roseicyclus persicicus TaxID=2650661 RepID=A0A7X6H2C5_9RHOB|nr:Yip1 family protein [Roseibacterium persicicum]NKX46084.1 YIP1 family protein [Roseibacterium persicicum]
MTQLLSLGNLLRMARDTVSNPREGAETVLALGLPRQALWLAFALVIVLSMILGDLLYMLADLPADEALTGPLGASPVVMGLLQAGFLYLMAHAMARIGQAFGGTGRFEEALALVIWLQFIFLCVQVVQLVAVLVVPPVAGLITLLAMGLFLWLLVNFVATLHGFTSLGMVFVMTLLSAFAILFLLSLVLTMLGLTFGTT